MTHGVDRLLNGLAVLVDLGLLLVLAPFGRGRTTRGLVAGDGVDGAVGVLGRGVIGFVVRVVLSGALSLALALGGGGLRGTSGRGGATTGLVATGSGGGGAGASDGVASLVGVALLEFLEHALGPVLICEDGRRGRKTKHVSCVMGSWEGVGRESVGIYLLMADLVKL